MHLLSKALIGSLVLCAGVAIAAEATDPTTKARQELMDVIGMNTKILGDMAGGKAAYDAAAAEAAKTALSAAAGEIVAKFEPQATDPKSTAKPDIWTDFAGFTAKADVLVTAAAAIDVSSVDTIKAGMGGIGGACKDCHTTFRIPQ
jgi:cytochrome c556